MSSFVVDASVAVKWFVPEIHAEFADRLLTGDHDLHVPDLLFSEFGNILWKKVGRGEMTAEEARGILQALPVVPLSVHQSSPLLAAAFELALSVSRTVYDSLYLALAISLSCSLVTADERLFHAVEPTPFAANLTLVQDVT